MTAAAGEAMGATAGETRQYDVLVVGGGPAGLSAAEAAAKTGARVALLERRKEIGYPVHTSGGSWISDMRALGIPPDLYHPIRSVTFLSPSRSARFEYPEPVCCVLDVRGVYQYVAGCAIAAGAELHPGSPVERPIVEDGKIVGVVAKDHRNRAGEWRAPVVVDASGFSSTLVTRTGLRKGFQRYGYGAEYDLMAPNYDQDMLYLIMGSQVAPSGYAWAFPRGKGRVRLGVGVIRPDVDADAREYLDTFTERLPNLAPDFKGASPVEYHTGLFPSEGVVSSFVRDGLIATGDAAGQGSTLVGEGIRFALYSGAMAGEVAGEAAQAGDASAERLARYERQWRARFGREMDISYIVNQRIARWTDEQWDDSMDLLTRLTPAQAADLLRGDYSVGLFLGVLRRNPRLLRTGARK
ncbi:MAG TPA: NAD(P)/FAD-dependent oxidoreductase, partial [Ktedonobacterales bacterium]|nr:NAD(P)/FAD-dependent oxidoreductase [Ktedonobacterales bacterium]